MQVYNFSGTQNTKIDPLTWAKEVEKRGVGEILLTCIDNEGTWKGLNIELINRVASNISIPLIAHGGAGSVRDINYVLNNTDASAVGLGSMVVFQKKDMGVLINFPEKHSLSS